MKEFTTTTGGSIPLFSSARRDSSGDHPTLGADEARASSATALPRCVVFNADDFGASDATNAAILRAHREGALTTTSLMVNEPAAASATALAREAPALGVGLHVVLSDGRAALPHARIPHLADPSGRFRADPARAGIAAFFSRSARREVAAEVAEQFARFDAASLPLSHVDGHQHLHLHPVIWDAVVAECAARAVRVVRIPCEEFLPAGHARVAGRRAEWLFFRALRGRCRRSLARHGLREMDRVYGHLETGQMTEEYVVGLLGRLRGQTNEVYFHPGTPHARPLPDTPDMDVELAALLSPAVRQRIAALGLRLTTFAALPTVEG